MTLWAEEQQLRGWSSSSGHLYTRPEHLLTQQLQETPCPCGVTPHAWRKCGLAAACPQPWEPPPAPASHPLPQGDISAWLPALCITGIDGAGSIPPAGDQKAPKGNCIHLCPALGPGTHHGTCRGLGNASTSPRHPGAGAASPSPLLAPKPEIAEPVIPRGYK